MGKENDEKRLLKHHANTMRMRGNIDFSDMEEEKENGNWYLVFTVSSVKDAKDLSSLLKRKIETSEIRNIEFAGTENPSTENRYVKFTDHGRLD